MKILILGAAGQIGRFLTDRLLKETTHDLVSFARDGSNRIENTEPARVEIIDGDFKEAEAVEKAMKDVDVMYLNDMSDYQGVDTIVKMAGKAGSLKLFWQLQCIFMEKRLANSVNPLKKYLV